MAPNHNEDILRLIDGIISHREYFTANREDNDPEDHTDERKQRLGQLGDNARKLMFATQPPHLAFWELIRRV